MSANSSIYYTLDTFLDIEYAIDKKLSNEVISNWIVSMIFIMHISFISDYSSLSGSVGQGCPQCGALSPVHSEFCRLLYGRLCG